MKRRRKLQPLAINPLVVDLSHNNDVADFGEVKAAGYAGIIHKATEATGFVDKMYAIRRGQAMNAGLLWGAYHFLRPVSIPAQVDFFLKIAAPDNTTLLALDQQDERVTLVDAKEFPEGVDVTLVEGAVSSEEAFGDTVADHQPGHVGSERGVAVGLVPHRRLALFAVRLVE